MPDAGAVPAITVIVRVRAGSDLVSETLSSVRDDQDVDLELVTLDAGAPPAERAAAATGARGEFLLFLDGEDLVPRGALRAMLTAARAGDADLAVGRHLRFAPGSMPQPLGRAADFAGPPSALAGRPGLLQSRVLGSRLIRRDLWQRMPAGALDRSEDLVPSLAALLAAERIATVPDTVHIRRERAGVVRDGDFEARLREEADCARLLAEQAPKLLGELAAMQIRGEGWTRFRAFLRSSDAGQQEPAALEPAEHALRALLDGLPPLPAEGRGDGLRRRALIAASGGHWPEAAELAARADAPPRLRAFLGKVRRRLGQYRRRLWP